jgi:hypothetical protein
VRSLSCPGTSGIAPACRKGDRALAIVMTTASACWIQMRLQADIVSDAGDGMRITRQCVRKENSMLNTLVQSLRDRANLVRRSAFVGTALPYIVPYIIKRTCSIVHMAIICRSASISSSIGVQADLAEGCLMAQQAALATVLPKGTSASHTLAAHRQGCCAQAIAVCCEGLPAAVQNDAVEVQVRSSCT